MTTEAGPRARPGGGFRERVAGVLGLGGRAPPGPGYARATWLFRRTLAVVYAAAFLSLAVQLRGLVGREGILPAGDYLHALATRLGGPAWHVAPSLAWISSSDAFLMAMVVAGAFLSLCLFLGIAERASAALLWALYLSLVVVGQEFLSYQWDILLLETGFLAIFLVPGRPAGGGARPWRVGPRFWRMEEPPRLALWLLWWLLFRLVFESGLVKLASGDPAWRHLTALSFHYWTQPLPNPVSWYAAKLPMGADRAATLAAMLIELGAPLLFALGRRPRRIGAAAIALLQLSIFATGNYGAFNLLTLALCLPLVDDGAWEALARRCRAGRAWLARLRDAGGSVAEGDRQRVARAIRGEVLAAFAVLAIPVGAAQVAGAWEPALQPAAIRSVERGIAPFALVNGYGLFAVMTETRPVIVLEGKGEGGSWQPYDFRWQTDRPGEMPREAGLHMPRLDWQLWFAGLTAERSVAQGRPAFDRWFLAFARRLLAGSLPVTRLLAPDSPFREQPPEELRADLYLYRFTTAAQRARTGDWWTRRKVGAYLPPVRLRDGRLELATGDGDGR